LTITFLFIGLSFSIPEKIKILNQYLNIREILPFIISVIITIILISTLLKIFLDYLDTKSTTSYKNEQLYKLEKSYKKLLDLKFNSSINITENEKEDLLHKLTIQFENSITDDFKRKIEEKIKINDLQTVSKNSIIRLQEEINSLNRRGNINLFIGMLLSLSGLIYLGFTVFFSYDYTKYEILFSHLIPRAFFAIFIQIFSFFFLNLYKKGLEDIKYYQNEITNLEAKYLALDIAKQTNNFKLISNALNYLLNTERNFILKKDETTIDLEKNKIESQASNNTVQVLKDIINFKR
jgi:hypothetical protein